MSHLLKSTSERIGNPMASFFVIVCASSFTVVYRAASPQRAKAMYKDRRVMRSTGTASVTASMEGAHEY